MIVSNSTVLHFEPLILESGFGRCPLPVRQVAILGLSLIATIVYLRWKDSPVLRSSDGVAHVCCCLLRLSPVLFTLFFLSEEQTVEQLGARGAHDDC